MRFQLSPLRTAPSHICRTSFRGFLGAASLLFRGPQRARAVCRKKSRDSDSRRRDLENENTARGIVKNLHQDFLASREKYDAAVNYWRVLCSSILETKGQIGAWERGSGSTGIL